MIAALVILTAITAAVLLSMAGRAVKRHGAGRLVFRFLAGRHMDGIMRTDAGWSKTPTRVLHPAGRAGWWAHQTERTRAAWRLAGVALAAGEAAMWLLARAAAPWLSGLLGLGLAAAGGWLVRRRVRQARHRREVIRPMSAALAPFLGTAPRALEAGLEVRPDYADAEGGEHLGSLTLPDHWAATAPQKAQVEEIVRARLGVDLKPQWRTSQYPMVLNLARAPQPPGKVLLEAELAELAAAPAHVILLGRDSQGAMQSWDRSSEDPHVAVHGGSRRGKTSLLLSMAAQDLARGATVTAIDPKRVGLLELCECPGFTLYSDPRDVAAMWDAVARFRAEVERRYDELAADPTAEFKRTILIVDEVSMFAGMSLGYWREIKERGAPPLPPVWGDVAAAVYMGAQAGAHVIVAGQRLDYAILGGMLGSFGTRLLAGFQPLDYARLIGIPPVLRSQKPRGRFLLYAGDDPVWLQLIYGRPDQWRDYALGHSGQAAEGSTGEGARAPGDPVGLAAGASHLGLSVDAFRQRRHRTGPIPGEYRIGNQPAWKRADLDRWAGRGEQAAIGGEAQAAAAAAGGE